MAQKGSALVGTGFIGPVHVEALRRLGRPVVGVLASSPAKSKQAAAALQLPRAYATYTELLADPDVAAVHLTSPNRFHFEQCRQALLARKHVICEKPLAMTTQETAELLALAEKTPAVAAVCYNIRFYPLCLEARERIRAGHLGDIYHVTGSYVQDWLLYDTDFNWRVLAAAGGALRAVADIGTHWLDLVQSITGLGVQRVCADLHTVLPTRRRPIPSPSPPGAEGAARGASLQTFQSKLQSTRDTEPVAITTEDYGSILLHFDATTPHPSLSPKRPEGDRGGARGCFTVSQVNAGRKNCLRFEIAGSSGALAWNSETPNELWLGQRDRPNEVLLRDPALMQPAVRPFADFPGGHNEGFPDSFKQLFRAIYDYIDRGDLQAPRPFPTFADGHREVVLCEAILKSQHERRWVETPRR